MHTFFINTSGKELDNYSDIFDIQHETKQLVSLDCPLTEWSDEAKGYEACVRTMGELIDSYKDINNDFNLILYVDLLAYKQYTAIPMSEHQQRAACLQVLRTLLRHYIQETLVKKLRECGRSPQEVLLIFEENQLPTDEDRNSAYGKERIRGYVREFLGLPAAQELDGQLFTLSADGQKQWVTPQQFCQQYHSPLSQGVLGIYQGVVESFLERMTSYEDCHEPYDKLLQGILEYRSTVEQDMESVSFVTNRKADISNKREYACRNLRLCLYILSCVEDGTIYDRETFVNGERPKVKGFPEINWNQVVTRLSEKAAAFQANHRRTQSLSDNFSDLGLAPYLYQFDHERFSLDQFGKKSTEFTLTEAKEDKKEKPQEGQPQSILGGQTKQSLEVRAVSDRKPIITEGYPTFRCGNVNVQVEEKATEEQYIEAAKKLRREHLNYLHSLKVHVSERLSNYAGRSEENEPALLRKRKVSAAEEDFQDTDRDYQYIKTNRHKETQKLKTVEDISATAYDTTLLNYMEFCAGRSVAVTDIEEQCDWFITRIKQITESLRKIKRVAIGLLLALLVLYVPFGLLQWEAITVDMITFTIALCSVLVPVVLLCAVYGVAALAQRKKYAEAWGELKKQSQLVMEENQLAAEKYDQLLNTFVPSLRWVYEYRLDVEFYADCCKMARAKLSHHIQKLHDRVVVIGNIIEDLEVYATDIPKKPENWDKTGKEATSQIDYNVSFCSGSVNKAFYAILDAGMLEANKQ